MTKCRLLCNGLFLLLFITGRAFAEPAANGSVAPEQQASTEEQTSTEEPAEPSPFEQSVRQILPDNNKRLVKLESGRTIYQKSQIIQLYQKNGWLPLWKTGAITALAEALKGLAGDGLNPDEYRFQEIVSYLDDTLPAEASLETPVEIDILLTEAYLRALYNLHYGKVDPQRLDADYNYEPTRDGEDHTEQFLSWIQQGAIDQAFDWARPNNDSYRWLKAALHRYQSLQAAGGWEEIPKGKSIKPGASDSRIALIRRRLAITGDLDSDIGPDQMDEPLQQGVKRFQQRHTLDTDAVIGPATLAALNVPVEQRIDQIRANMERQRWFFPQALDEYLLVDVAGFRVYWFKNQEIIWQEQVQVGKRFTKTPIFQDQIEHIIFNPTWSIPPGIKRRTILPSLKANPSYLKKKGYKLVDSSGKTIDPYSINWNAMSRLPYTVRQPSGRGNALGRVKFMFPNKHSVFLHDTNHKELFGKQVRTTSSGCIRLRNPFDLAERLLGQQEGWDRARIDKILDSGRTIRANLDKPLPILIQYRTAVATEQAVSFRKDIYERDDTLLAALQEPFSLHLPDLPKSVRSRILAGVKSASAPVQAVARAEIISRPVVPVPDVPVPDVPVVVEEKSTPLFQAHPVEAPSFLDL